MPKNTYSTPLKESSKFTACSDPEVHAGFLKNAIDFCVKEGTQVFAAADGIVISVKDDSNEGGIDKKYFENIEKYMNKIEIEHANGEISGYYHIKHKSAKVQVGDKVKKGQLIAESGNTGPSSEPHLHFMVVKNGKSIKIKFDNFDRQVIRR